MTERSLEFCSVKRKRTKHAACAMNLRFLTSLTALTLIPTVACSLLRRLRIQGRGQNTRRSSAPEESPPSISTKASCLQRPRSSWASETSAAAASGQRQAAKTRQRPHCGAASGAGSTGSRRVDGSTSPSPAPSGSPTCATSSAQAPRWTPTALGSSNRSPRASCRFLLVQPSAGP